MRAGQLLPPAPTHQTSSAPYPGSHLTTLEPNKSQGGLHQFDQDAAVLDDRDAIAQDRLIGAEEKLASSDSVLEIGDLEGGVRDDAQERGQGAGRIEAVPLHAQKLAWALAGVQAEGWAVALVGPPLGGWNAQVVEDQLDAIPLDHLRRS